MTVLVIAAHPDDEVLGVGATIALLRARGNDVHVAIVTEGSSAQYPDRPDLIAAKREQARVALDALGGGTLHFGELPDMKLDTIPLVRVNAFLEDVVRRVRPTIVFTHHPDDLNRDHRIVFESSVVACRASEHTSISELMCYDVLGVSNFGGSRAAFVPSVFYPGENHLPAKIAALRAYDIEIRTFPHPRSVEAIDAQGRVYGSLCGSRWAEAFQLVRSVR